MEMPKSIYEAYLMTCVLSINEWSYPVTPLFHVPSQVLGIRTLFGIINYWMELQQKQSEGLNSCGSTRVAQMQLKL